ncbi:VWA domain-containing protein [Paramagnetospirillum kuznetsovii]|uniref:VWA domain-containing protein n=1 Tax=Paramagnetospirillum kuznetsovii TaxID=2053833 RepID=A0A364P1H9_9PROT|nr:VWA domain-containing protein [Paramagnetospirillum kuznetsovii]RAU23192.1 VWA domain-containing protein [Paramagnetospirillum kuznetsovii]
MFLTLFLELRDAKVPVTLKEYLTLMEALQAGVAEQSVDTFYYLARSCLVKDERNLDKFDRIFGKVFQGVLTEADALSDAIKAAIPEEWLRRLAEKHLSPEEMAEIKSLGGFDKLMETLRKRLEEQKERHQGGSKWIGTAGTSPFGAYGYNPEGVRIGQNESRHRRAVKVWDERAFKNLDDGLELGTRNYRIALRRLRKFAREGAATELDLPGTIRSTARSGGMLDLQMVPERHNKVKVLLLLDIGGSMDEHVRTCEELFSAVRSEFKHLEHFYFHNCPYSGLWKDNRRRHQDVTHTWDVIHTFPSDYKLIFVGDAAMSPYEITVPGGAVEEWNEEPGHVWMQRLLDQWPSAAWLNPTPQSRWQWTHSTGILAQLMGGRMHPLTLEGLDLAMRDLNRGASAR